MVYIYLPVAYYHLNLDVLKRICWWWGFFAVPAVFLVVFKVFGRHSVHLFPNGLYQKWPILKQMGVRFWTRGTLVTHVWDTLNQVMFKVLVAHLLYLHARICLYSGNSIDGYRLTGLWDSALPATHIWGTGALDLVLFKVFCATLCYCLKMGSIWW